MARVTFRIPIGDWSGDGHGRADWYTATANRPLTEVRDAYFDACSELPKHLCPESFVSDYQDGVVPDDVVADAAKLGFIINEADFGTREMAEYVCWFINHGDIDCDVRLEDIDDMLPFYGMKDNRHIGFIGYGITGD